MGLGIIKTPLQQLLDAVCTSDQTVDKNMDDIVYIPAEIVSVAPEGTVHVKDSFSRVYATIIETYASGALPRHEKPLEELIPVLSTKVPVFFIRNTDVPILSQPRYTAGEQLGGYFLDAACSAEASKVVNAIHEHLHEEPFVMAEKVFGEFCSDRVRTELHDIHNPYHLHK